MATSSTQTKTWNIYSTYHIPTKSSKSSCFATSSDEQTSTAKPECLSYGRQRSVFPFGIVRENDWKETHNSSESNEKCLPGNLTTTANGSSPCSSSSRPVRWGTKILQSIPPQIPGLEDSIENPQPTVTHAKVRGYYRKRTYSCPSTPVNGFLRIEVPKLSSIMVQAHSVPLVRRRSQSSPSKTFNTSTASMGSLRRSFERAGRSLPPLERSEKTVSDEKAAVSASGEKAKELLKSLSEFKIEDGIIIINNGKAIDIRKDKLRKNQTRKTKKHVEAAKSKSYREFQDAMQKFEDAHLSLEGEVNAKAKTFETRESGEQQFFNKNVQTPFMDLLTSVKQK